MLVFDTETTTDPTQALIFGCWRLFDVVEDGRLACVQEGLFHTDHLAETDPEGYDTIRQYGRDHHASVDLTRPFANWDLTVLSRREFLDRVLYKAAYERPQATVVCFNFPFDITRLATHAGAANYFTKTSKKDPAKKPRLSGFAGGFSIRLWDFDGADHQWRPRIGIKTIDSKRALKVFMSPSEIDEEDLDDGKAFKGSFLDARTLTFALTNEGHTLESATRAFDVPYVKRPVNHGVITEEYITYCREDVEATANLYGAAMEEYRRHPIALQATKAYSPASIAKSYLRAMGIRPMLSRHSNIPNEVLGWATSAFYGGRAECRIRKVPVPVELVDFTSMYPTVDALMGMWSLLTADRVEVHEDTESIQGLLDTVTAEQCFDPALWSEFVGIAQIVPDGDVVPCRARYGDGPSWNIGINPLTSREPMWFTVADLVAGKVLSGKTPKVVRALRFLPSRRRLAGLKPVQLRGEVDVEPRRMDFFTSVIEERQRIKQTTKDHPTPCSCPDCRTAQFLKVLANSGSYGIYAEMVRHELGTKHTTPVTVFGKGAAPFGTKTGAPETPGEYCFPPVAACITGAARLMLALLEAMVVGAGGSWAMCDTDSMAIVATEEGGLIPCPGGAESMADGTEAVRALSYETVEEIRDRFASLNPYAQDAVEGTVLQKVARARCYVISAKRYALYDVVDGQVVLSEKKSPSEHGLGHLLDPTREDHSTEELAGEEFGEDELDPARPAGKPWIAEAWRWLLSEAEGLPAEEPWWVDRRAITRLGISSPALLRPFDGLNKGKPYPAQVKPSNFLLVAHVAPFGYPAGVEESRFRLVAPFEPLASKWGDLPWRNLYDPSGFLYATTTRSLLGERGEATEVRIQTLRDMLLGYRNHPEMKSLGPNGQLGGRSTVGLLARRPVNASSIRHIGKEANHLEDVDSGLIGDLGEVLNEYSDPVQDPLRTLALPVLQGLSDREIGRCIGVDHKTVGGIRKGTRPHQSMRERLWGLAVETARARSVHPGCPPEALALLAEVGVEGLDREGT